MSVAFKVDARNSIVLPYGVYRWRHWFSLGRLRVGWWQEIDCFATLMMAKKEMEDLAKNPLPIIREVAKP